MGWWFSNGVGRFSLCDAAAFLGRVCLFFLTPEGGFLPLFSFERNGDGQMQGWPLLCSCRRGEETSYLAAPGRRLQSSPTDVQPLLLLLQRSSAHVKSAAAKPKRKPCGTLKAHSQTKQGVLWRAQFISA